LGRWQRHYDSGVAAAADDIVTLPGGRRVQLWEGGDPTGLATFFFHGCPDCRLAARPGDGAALRTGVRLIAHNRPGYGQSDAHASSHESVADDVLRLADGLGVERFVVLGMSLGGPYALACAVAAPERVLAVGLVASPAIVPELQPPYPRDGLSPAQQSFFRLLAERSVSQNVEVMRPDFEAYVEALDPHNADDATIAARLLGELHPLDAAAVGALPETDVAVATRESLVHPEGYLRDAALAFRTWDFRPEDIGCPTWIWHGELDPQASVRNARWLAERIPRSTLVIRSGSAHLSTLLNHWDEIFRRLREAAQAHA
jgi:pimeloyl-ACP methyl ester carboxylesterase